MDAATAQAIALMTPLLLGLAGDAISYCIDNDIEVPSTDETLAAIDRLQAMVPLVNYRAPDETAGSEEPE